MKHSSEQLDLSHSAARKFRLDGEIQQIEPFGSGHINDTFRLAVAGSDGLRRFVLQRLNSRVFSNPGAVMENIRRVTAHLARKITGQPDAGRRVLTLVPAFDGNPCWTDGAGGCWRVFPFIEETRTVDVIESPAQAFAVARAFGVFAWHLSDLPAPRLQETISAFHHTPRYFDALMKAVASDVSNRAALARREIEFAMQHEATGHVLLDAHLPERVNHNDTKINNVLLDMATGEGVCVIDLDTVMPGLAPCDFGDLVRSAANPAREDEPDLSKVEMRFSLYEALLRGYLAGAGEVLTPAEKNLLPVSCQVIAFELGVRFLTDFLSGDVYFKTRREGQNLDRCRVQFKLVESMRLQEASMRRLLEGIQ